MIAASGSGSSSFIFIIVIAFVLLWLLVVRPQKKRQSQTQRMLSDLRVGDDVVTAGGIYGRVTRIDEDEIRVEVAPNVEVRVARRAIGAILTEHEEPQTVAAGDTDETEAPKEDNERWQSAFDDEGSDEDSGADKPR